LRKPRQSVNPAALNSLFFDFLEATLTMFSQQPISVQRIRSISMTVSDVERSRDFYTSAIGFKPVSDLTVNAPEYSQLFDIPNAVIRIVTLQLSDESIKLMQFLNLPSRPIPADSQSNDLWFQHLAIAVGNMDRAYAQLQSFLVESISDAPQTMPASNPAAAGIRAFKFKDPDGHDLELIWYPVDKGQEKWHQKTDRLFLGIDHTAIAIADTEQSLRFYRDLLGMEVEGDSLNQGETQARLDDLPEAKVRVTALRPAQGGLGIELLDYLIPEQERPIPNSWKCSDIAHLHIEMALQDIEETAVRLCRSGVQFVSPHWAQFSGSLAPDRKGCLVKDPNGHALFLIEA
jgi:catechol 2,3-dioxygenase-like lactoylglutathione lyase family enzyme